MSTSIPEKSRVVVVGGGPAGLIAAEKLAEAGHRVSVYDRMPSVGRKFLMAGRGGLNLTHAEPLGDFLRRYEPVSPLLLDTIRAFPPESLRDWCEGLGHETFAGTSGRVFPREMKASPLLRSWLRRLATLGVEMKLRHDLIRIEPDRVLTFRVGDEQVSVKADAVLLALGGASWPRLGANGGWQDVLVPHGIDFAPLRPANAGIRIDWTPHFRDRQAGQPLKRIHVRIGGHEALGEAVITEAGLEGGAVYALFRPIREAIERKGEAWLTLDLRPDFRPEFIASRFAATNRKESFSSRLRKAAGLQPPAVALVTEAMMLNRIPMPKDDPTALATLVKALPLRVTGTAGLERAISTAGGIRFAALDSHFMLESLPGVFAAGEMLDWEAPTGGYLLQGCFATGIAAARGAIAFLENRNQSVNKPL